MASSYTPPTISVSYDLDTNAYCLMATNYSRTSVAGPRIFRAEPWPEVRFSCDTQDDAENQAATLRSYLEDCASGKRKDNTKPTKRGWWQD